LNNTYSTNKRKIFNDPVYGFITLRHEILFDLIDHPYFQRLRRIKQLGLTHLVYPGALHTRFHHALGAMHLMNRAIDTLRSKGHEITEEEALGAAIAILLHDIGHGPFSHALEFCLVDGIHHEEISIILMEELNQQFDGKLSTGIAIFKDEYPKKFLHQLVSSQLDMDRLDYLKRDSFYTGVTEGDVGSDRIIKMLNVADNELVIDEKAVYSIENYIVARRFMYWQVYLHKTVVSAEHMIIHVLKLAKKLAMAGEELFASPALKKFLYGEISGADMKTSKEALNDFTLLDDNDVMGAIKVWMHHPNKALSLMSTQIINRELFKIQISKEEIRDEIVDSLKEKIKLQYELSTEDIDNFVFTGELVNNAYNPSKETINLLLKNGKTLDIVDASDNLNISPLSQPVKKYFVCFPRLK
jgi:HD superfamily phosphohydrolase